MTIAYVEVDADVVARKVANWTKQDWTHTVGADYFVGTMLPMTEEVMAAVKKSKSITTVTESRRFGVIVIGAKGEATARHFSKKFPQFLNPYDFYVAHNMERR